MQQTHTHKALTGRFEVKKLLSRRRQSEYSSCLWRPHCPEVPPFELIFVNLIWYVDNAHRSLKASSLNHYFFLFNVCKSHNSVVNWAAPWEFHTPLWKIYYMPSTEGVWFSNGLKIIHPLWKKKMEKSTTEGVEISFGSIQWLRSIASSICQEGQSRGAEWKNRHDFCLFFPIFGKFFDGCRVGGCLPHLDPPVATPLSGLIHFKWIHPLQKACRKSTTVGMQNSIGIAHCVPYKRQYYAIIVT